MFSAVSTFYAATPQSKINGIPYLSREKPKQRQKSRYKAKSLNSFFRLQEFDTSKVLLEIASLVATGCEENVIKLLLLLEYYLRLEQTDFAEVSKLFSAPLKELSTSSQLARQTVIKTNKVMFVIEANMRLQKNEKNVDVSP